MHPTVLSSPRAFVLMLWLSTLVLGSVLLFCLALLIGWDFSGALLAALGTGFAAGCFSLPTLPVLLVGIRWVLAAPTNAAGWRRLSTLATSASGLSFGCAYWVLNDDGFARDLASAWLALPYLPAALLVAAGMYRQQLRRLT